MHSAWPPLNMMCSPIAAPAKGAIHLISAASFAAALTMIV